MPGPSSTTNTCICGHTSATSATYSSHINRCSYVDNKLAESLKTKTASGGVSKLAKLAKSLAAKDKQRKKRLLESIELSSTSQESRSSSPSVADLEITDLTGFAEPPAKKQRVANETEAQINIASSNSRESHI